MATEVVLEKDLRPTTSRRVPAEAPTPLARRAVLPASRQARQPPDAEEDYGKGEQGPAEEEDEAAH